MKRSKFLLVAIISAFLFGCGNSELESRITKLEGRVAALEGGNVSAKPSTTINPTSTNTASAPSATVTIPEGPLPAFKFEKDLHDFGNIKEGDVVEYTFAFVNNGEAPLIISDAKATCGCTVPQYPKEPIPVGGSGEIQVRFNSSKKPGIQNKTVTLTANTYPAQTRIRIKANVEKQDS